MEEGKLGLNDPLTKFVPDFPNGDTITIEELLSHYSGLGDASAQSDYAEWSRFPQTTLALVERAKTVSRHSEPATAYFYSNSNYHILAFVIEQVSGKNHGDFLHKRIFKLAEMTNTAHRAKDETIVANLAKGTRRRVPLVLSARLISTGRFWSFIRFEKTKLIYRNSDKDYIAFRQ